MKCYWDCKALGDITGAISKKLRLSKYSNLLKSATPGPQRTKKYGGIDCA